MMLDQSTDPHLRRGNAWITALPLIILGASAVVLALKWSYIPLHWAIHWRADGLPDQWATRSVSSVFLPIVAGSLVCFFLEGVVWFIRLAARSKHDQITSETRIAIGELTAQFVRFISIAVSVVFAYAALVFPLFRPTSPVGFIVLVFVLVGGAIVLGMIRLRNGVRGLKRAGHKGLEGYNGLIYRNPNDSRLWVPKLAGIGYTLNFAHPWAWPVLLLFLSIPLLVVVAIILVG